MTKQAMPDSAALLVPDLRRSISGRVITPADRQYEESRQVFNAAVDRRPAAIVRAVSAEDVSAVVSAVAEARSELAVRGGGHSFAGHGASEGGIVLDTSAMRGLEIDLTEQTAWAQAGLTAAEYTGATARHGLATGFGDTGSVGIAGITLGGGIGWLVRKHGLTIDDLLAVEVVGADGELRHVDADSHPDLFWALRGGGGNFGVVTRLRFRLHKVDSILGGTIVLPASPAILRSFVAAAAESPDELSTIAYVRRAPPLPFIPPEHRGKLVLAVMVAYSGGAEAGRRALDPIRRLATPIVDAVRPMPYPEIYASQPGPERAPIVVRSAFLDDVGESTAKAIVGSVRTACTDTAVAQIRVLGGAIARVPAEATAFAHRDRSIMLVLGAMGGAPQESFELDAWVEGAASAAGIAGSPAYVNYIGDEGGSRVRDAYPTATYRKLVSVKRRFDPTNVFRLNQNVSPDS